MKFTRHAKNALRRAARKAKWLSEEAVFTALLSAEILGLDMKGNMRALVIFEEVELVVVIDVERQVVVTLWER